MTAGFVHSGDNAGYLVRLFIMALTSAICILWFYVDLQMFSQNERGGRFPSLAIELLLLGKSIGLDRN